jgi:lysozyme
MLTRLLAGHLQLSLPVACHLRAATRGVVLMSKGCDPRTYPFIAYQEGKVLKAYHDAVRVVTIGYGFTMGSKIFAAFCREKHGRALRLGDTISLDDANMLLKKLVDEEYLKPVERGAPNAPPHAKGGAASMLFNCGLGAAKWSWFLSLAAGHVAEAAVRLRVTATTARGVRLPGLVRRRKEEAAIIEKNQWPSWVKVPANLEAGGIIAATPANPLQEDDFDQGLQWLVELGFLAAAHDDEVIKKAVITFQSQHKQLTVDGIMGKATLTQLQRVVDLKRKAKRVSASGATVTGAGAADYAAAASGHADYVMIGGVAFAALGVGFLAWRYRDELKIALSRKVML